MAKFLVTGGAGFIGSHLVDALVAAGHAVRVLDDLQTGDLENLRASRNRVEFIRGSITDRTVMRRAAEGVRSIFHLAALPSVQRSVEDPVSSHEVCATGTLQVLQAAHQAGVRRVVYAASSSAYGETPGTLRYETDPVAPVSPYAVAKLAGEYYCNCFLKVYGLETVRLRFFNIFGPRQNPWSPYSGVIAQFIARMSAGQAPTIFGDGLQSRDFTYVANAVQAMLRAEAAPAAPGNVYNIGNGGTVTLLTLVEELNRLLGTNLEPTHAAPRAGDVRHSQADITRARLDLGYEPGVSFQEGLRLSIAAKKSGKRRTAVRLTNCPAA
jgi:UDP-glucose 4-epimerase